MVRGSAGGFRIGGTCSRQVNLRKEARTFVLASRDYLIGIGVLSDGGRCCLGHRIRREGIRRGSTHRDNGKDIRDSSMGNCYNSADNRSRGKRWAHKPAPERTSRLEGSRARPAPNRLARVRMPAPHGS